MNSRHAAETKPLGHRQSHFHQSPHHKIDSSFNFWFDVHTNQSNRNRWEAQEYGNSSVISSFKEEEERKKPKDSGRML